MDLRICNVLDEKEIAKVIEFVSKQEQYYPKFNEWINEKLKPRMLSGRYKSYFGMENDSISGCVIYDILYDEVAIKNFRIDKEYRHRFLGQFLLKQVENLNKPIITDITVSNFDAVKFFMLSGFNIISMEKLYMDNQFEYIIKKNNNI